MAGRLVCVGPLAISEIAGVGRQVLGDPLVSAYHAPLAYGDAAQDGGVGVYHHVVADDGMARYALHERAVVVLREVSRPQGYALVQGDVVADDARGPYHHARAVVDGEALADAGLGVDVDSRLGVGKLGDDPRDERHVELHQLVGDAVA